VREASLWGVLCPVADHDQEQNAPSDDGTPPSDNPYGFAIAVITLLLTCGVTLLLALHSILR